MDTYNDYVQALYKESKGQKRNEGYKTTRSRSQRHNPDKRIPMKDLPRDEYSMENNVAQMAMGIKNLEGLYGSLDRKMCNLKSDLESKFDQFARDHKKKMDSLEDAHMNFETRLTN